MYCYVEMKDTGYNIDFTPVTRGAWNFYCSSYHNPRVEWKEMGKGWERFSQATFAVIMHAYVCENITYKWTYKFERYGEGWGSSTRKLGRIGVELCSIICTLFIFWSFGNANLWLEMTTNFDNQQGVEVGVGGLGV